MKSGQKSGKTLQRKGNEKWENERKNEREWEARIASENQKTKVVQ